ncbi:MAG: hypothetical protein ACK5LC_10925, partial [Coprobacillaceae bacterium]
SKNLINDVAFALQYLKRCTRLGMGLNKAIYNLRNYGIDSGTIDHCLEELEDDEEYNAAIEIINTLYQRNANNSYKAIIKKIRDRLYFKGFTNETIERAMADYDFSYSAEKEEGALEQEFYKQLYKYQKKMSGNQLNEKLIDVLLRKGYNYENIKQLIKQRGDI